MRKLISEKKKLGKGVLRVIFMFCAFLPLSIFAYPEPSSGTALVNGEYSEWDLTTDFYSEMREAGNFSKPKDLLSRLYMRYDCNNNTAHVLVLVVDGLVPDQTEDMHGCALFSQVILL